jgi:hypothetical protein
VQAVRGQRHLSRISGAISTFSYTPESDRGNLPAAAVSESVEYGGNAADAGCIIGVGDHAPELADLTYPAIVFLIYLQQHVALRLTAAVSTIRNT